MSHHLHAPHTGRRELQQGMQGRHVETSHSSLPRAQEAPFPQYSNNQYWNPSNSSSNVYHQTPSQAPRDNGTSRNWHMSGPGQNTYASSSSQSYPQQDASSMTAVETLTASFQVQVALPSKEQVQTYLMQHMKKPLGLYQGWKIEGVQLDIYELFSSVLRAGGSSEVSRQNLWPVVATILSLPAAPGTNGLRASPTVGGILRKFFLELLGGLEILWDQTRNLEGSRTDSGNRHSQPVQPQQVESQPHSRAPSHFGSAGRYDERASSQPQVQPQPQRSETTPYNRPNDYYGSSGSNAQQSFTAPTSNRYDVQTQPTQSTRQRAPVAQNSSSAERHMGTMAPSDMHLRQLSANQPATAQSAPPPSASTEANVPASAKPKKTKKAKKQDAPVEPPPPPAPVAPVQQPAATQEANGSKRKRRTPAEMAEFRAAKAVEKEAKEAKKAAKSGTAAEPTAGPSVTRREPTPLPPASVPAAQETDEAQPKKKRKRRPKAEIEAEKARKAAEAAAAAPPLVYHENGIVKIDTFDELVNSNFLPLPPAAPDVVSEKPGTGARYYAARCQELRTAVKRNRDKTPYRELSDDEIHFWNALVSILKHNSSITVPGADYFANQEAAEAEAAAAQAKKGGRPKKPRDENGNIIRDPAQLAAIAAQEAANAPAPAEKQVKRKASPERDEDGKVIKRVRGRLRGDGLAKYVNEDGEISWRIPANVVARQDADGKLVPVNRPMPAPTHHGITAQAYEARAQAIHRPMESMMSVFGANPARAYAREEDQNGHPIIRRNLAYPGSVDKRIVHLSKVVTPAKLRKHFRPMRIIGEKEDTPEPPPVELESSDDEDEQEVEPEQPKEPTPPPQPRFVLDAIEFGFMPPATLRKYRNPEEPEPALQINAIDVEMPGTVDDQFDDYEPLPEWEEEEGMNVNLEPELAMDTPTRRGTRSNPAAPLMPTPAAVRLHKQLRGQKGPKGKVLGTPRRSRLSVVSYPEATPPPPEPRRTRSGLVVETPAAGSSRRPIASNNRVKAVQVQSEPRKTRSGLVHTPSQSARPAKRGNRAITPQAQSTPRRTRSGMVIALTWTPPPDFDLYDEGDITPPLESIASRRNTRTQVEQSASRTTRSGILVPASQPGPAQRSARTVRKSKAVAPPEPRRTRSRRSPSVQPPVQRRGKKQEQRRTAANMVQRKVAKPKAISRPVVSIANSARRLRSMRYNMSLRKGGRDKKGAIPPKQAAPAVPARQASMAKSAAPSKIVKAVAPAQPAQGKAARVQKSVRQATSVEESADTDEYNEDGRGLLVVELPTRNKTLAETGGYKSNGVDRAVVALPIKANKRFNLVQSGAYDPSRDDESVYTDESDSDVELISMPYTAKRHANVRARTPEPIPIRFPARGVREQNPLLDVRSLLARTIEHPCAWKGCDAILASEELLRKHVYHRDHAFEGRISGEKQTLWRCLWTRCGLSVFRTQGDLSQHISAKHVARVLRCPFEFCDATSPTVQHLGRHIERHHEDEEPLPLANLSQLLEPDSPEDDLPDEIPIERLAAPPVAPSSYGGRDAWVRERVQAKCFAPAEPEMRVRHPVHILQRIEGEMDVSEEEDASDDTDIMVPRSWPGRKTAVVEIPTVKRRLTKRDSPEPMPPIISHEDGDVSDAGEGEWEDVDDSRLEGDEEAWMNGEEDFEDLEDVEAEDVADEEETAKWGDETLALVDYPSDSEDRAEDGEEESAEGDDEDVDMDEDTAAVVEYAAGDEGEGIEDEEGEDIDADNDVEESDPDDVVDADANQVRFEFDMADEYVQPEGAERIEAYEQIGTPFALAASPRAADAEDEEAIAEAEATEGARLDEQTQDLIRAVQVASEVAVAEPVQDIVQEAIEPTAGLPEEESADQESVAAFVATVDNATASAVDSAAPPTVPIAEPTLAVAALNAEPVAAAAFIDDATAPQSADAAPESTVAMPDPLDTVPMPADTELTPPLPTLEEADAILGMDMDLDVDMDLDFEM